MDAKELLILQKRGKVNTRKSIDVLIGALVVVLIIVALAPQFFTGLGTGANGLGNTTANPSVPTWLPGILIILVAVGLLYIIYDVFIK